MWTCRNCRRENQEGAERCVQCKVKRPAAPAEVPPSPSSKVLVTTAASFPNHRITGSGPIVGGECAMGMNIFSDFFASVRDVVGGRSESLQKNLRTARQHCIEQMKAEADRIGANGIIGVKLDYSEFSGGGKSMLFVAATGTAVTLEELEHTPAT